MKSERRHELQTNSLADSLSHAPQFLREHGSKILLGLIIVLLITMLIYQRSRRSAEELDIGWMSISTARSAIQRIELLPQMVQDPTEVAGARKQFAENASTALAPVMASDNRQIAAEAYLLRGDLNWTLANTPVPAVATTQPSAAEPTTEDYLARAQEAFEKVVRVYPEQSSTVQNARFGLAAIAENRRDFETAAKLYREITGDPQSTESYKNLAEMRLAVLEDLKNPIFIAAAPAPTTAATAPASATAPGTAPAAQSPAPATQPAR